MKSVTKLSMVGLFVIALLGVSTIHASPVLQAGQPITLDNAASVKQLALLEGHQQAVFGIAFSPDGTLLASASVDRSVRLWDVATAKQTLQLDGHTQQAVAVGFTADGNTLLSAGYDKAIRLWDVKAGTQTEVQTGDPDKNILPPQISNLFNAFSPDGTLLAYNIDGSTSLYLWDVKTKVQHSLGIEPEGIYSFGPAVFTSDGTMLAASVNKDNSREGNRVVIWNISDVHTTDPSQGLNKPTTTLTGTADAFYGNSMAISPDGTLLAVVNTNDMSIDIFDVKAGTVLTTLPSQPPANDGSDNWVNGLAFSSDGNVLAVGSYDKALRLWDVKAGTVLATLTGHEGVAVVQISRDGTRMATANLDGTLELWGGE